jgi:hypothetical protein
MDTIMMDLTLAPWTGVEYPYHREILKGQPVFSVNTEPRLRTFTPVMNLRHVNNFLREGYEDALMTWKNRRAIVDQNILSDEEYQTLMDTPTKRWNDLPFLAELLRNKNYAQYHNIRHLYEDGLRDVFNFIGFPRGHGKQVDDLVQIGVSHKGSVDSVENVFGDDLMEGHMIGFMYTRYVDETTGNYGPFAIIPWYGFDYPSLYRTSYIDVNGFECFGMVTQIGTVDRWVSEHIIDPMILKESIGLIPQYSTRYNITPEPGCMRYHIHSRVYRVPFLMG